MKVGIITFHFVNNFGGVLQTYALQSYIKKEFNVEVEIIDYKNAFIKFTDTIRLFPITKNINEFFTGLYSINKRLRRVQKFKMFIEEYNQLTSLSYNRRLLYKKIPEIDKYICGSDQIWNPVITFGTDPCYFLDFVKDASKKIAYGPSIGIRNLSKRNVIQISQFVKKIQYLSVREESSRAFLEKTSSRQIETVIDPTFLLTKAEWEKVCLRTVEIKEPYILLYVMQVDKKVYEYARKIKKQTGLRIIEISRYGYKHNFVDEVIVDLGPREFLGLIKNAEYVCTNSYHGLAFSLIFQKQFFIIPSIRFTDRITNLLQLFDIKIYEKDKFEDEIKPDYYDKESVKSKIELEQEKSYNYLYNSLFAK